MNAQGFRASMPRVDLHSHTYHSPDSRSSFREISAACKRTGIDVLAVTDHNTAEGALEFAAWTKRENVGPTIIPGEEIMTDKGEVIGLYLTETIPKRTPLGEAIDAIRDQGGLFLLQHPFDPLRHGLDDESWNVDPDLIEVFNARTRLKASNEKAAVLAKDKAKPGCASSDAHSPSEYGSAYTQTGAFDAEDPKALVKAIAEGEPVGRASPPWVVAHSVYAKVMHKLRW